VASPEELIAALRRFGLEDDRLDSLVARSIGAPPVEFKAMDHITEAGELTPSQLADRLALTSGAVTALLDRLERLGWVKREPHPSDRRSVVVRRATPAESAAMQIYGPVAERIARVAAKMTSAEREAAIRFLEEAAVAAREQADELKERRSAATGSPGSDPAPTASPGRDSPPTPAA
jgi:DNA-binding MarR family transcriptional regulator